MYDLLAYSYVPNLTAVATGNPNMRLDPPVYSLAIIFNILTSLFLVALVWPIIYFVHLSVIL